MTLTEAQRYLAACKSRHRLYEVLPVECGPATASVLQQSCALDLALERARLALKEVHDAIVGVGFQSCKAHMTNKGRAYTVDLAVAAMITCEEIESPQFVMATTRGGKRVAAQVIAQILGNWHREDLVPVNKSGLVQTFTKRVVGF